MSRSATRPARPAPRLSVRPTGFGLLSLAVLAALQLTGGGVDAATAGFGIAVLTVLVVLGAVWPVVAARSLRIRVLDASTDGVVGGPLPLCAAATAAGLVGRLDVTFDELSTVPFTLDSRADRPLWLDLDAPRRGRFDFVRWRSTIDAPLGMVRVRATGTAVLPFPVWIGPGADVVAAPPAPPADAASDGELAWRHIGGDLVRTVRPYQIGDPAHLVHWPTTARSGELVVREFEPPAAPQLVIVVDLGSSAPMNTEDGMDPDPHGEAAVRRAASLATAAVLSGTEVVLVTCMDGTPVRGGVSTPRQIQRRLAVAGPGVVPAEPTNRGVLVVRREAAARGPST